MYNFGLKNKKAFIAGVADDNGFGWAIAKALAEEGVEIILGVWPPVFQLFLKSLESGRLNNSRMLTNGLLMDFLKIYPFDASFDSFEDIPQETFENKRYKDITGYTISEVASNVSKEFGNIDMLVHSLANGSEVQKPLLETSRNGYLNAISISSYSIISMLSHFGPIINKEGSVISLSYIASERTIPGYGGGMSSAKAALESDTRTLAWEAGRKWNIRVNTISAGPLNSRAARAIGFIDKMIQYSKVNAPLAKNLTANEIGNAAMFLLSPLASAITGCTLYVDNGLHAMGIASDSKSLS